MAGTYHSADQPLPDNLLQQYVPQSQPPPPDPIAHVGGPGITKEVMSVTARKSTPLTIFDQRWYFRLVQSKQSEGRARPLMADYTLAELSQRLLICYTPKTLPHQTRPFTNHNGQPGRIYSVFDSYVEFYEYLQHFPRSQRAFYEIILGEFPQKPHFDLDIASSECATRYPGLRIEDLAELLAQSVMTGIVTVAAELGLNLKLDKHVLLFSSHGPNKRSYHIVVHHYCHSNNEEARAFYEAVVKAVSTITGGKYTEFIDPGVYGPRQLFRLVGCQKIDSQRPKIFHETFAHGSQTYTHVYSEPVDNDEVKKLTLFYESLVSFTAGCQYLPSLVSDRKAHIKQYGQVDDLPPDAAQQCLTLLQQRMKETTFNITDIYGHTKSVKGSAPFSISEIRGHLILLKRHGASYCPICQLPTPHDNENPFMYVVKGRIYWDCRRCDSDAKFFVGYLVDGISTTSDLSTSNPIEETIDEGGVFSFGDYPVDTPSKHVIEEQAPKPQLRILQVPREELLDVTAAINHTASQVQTRRERSRNYQPRDTLRDLKIEW